MFHNISIFLIFCGVYVRQSVAVAVPCDGGKLGGKLSRSGLGRPDFWLYFCSTGVAVILAGGHGLPTHCKPLLICLLSTNYYSYDLPSAVTVVAHAEQVTLQYQAS